MDKRNRNLLKHGVYHGADTKNRSIWGEIRISSADPTSELMQLSASVANVKNSNR